MFPSLKRVIYAVIATTVHCLSIVRRVTFAGTRAQNLTVSELLATTGMCKFSTIPNTVDEMKARASHAQYGARPLNLRHNPRRLLW